MWQEVAVAAMVGLALSDSWLCLFMGASFAAVDRGMSWGFMAGRTLGVVALLLLIGLMGASLLPSKEWLVLLFAVSTVAVAVLLAVSTFRPRILGGCHHETAVACDGGEPDGTAACPGSCEGCQGHEGEQRAGCGRIPAWLVRRLSSGNPLATGFALGACRGAMPCLKVLVITPLLVASPPATVMLMALAFAATSALYPLVGLMSGRAVAAFLQRARWLRLAGALGVAAVGVVTLVRYYQQSCGL